MITIKLIHNGDYGRRVHYLKAYEIKLPNDKGNMFINGECFFVENFDDIERFENEIDKAYIGENVIPTINLMHK